MFFYGTLCHLPLLHLVLGRGEIDMAPATLEDHAAVWAEGQSFPLIRAAPGARAQGLVVRGLSAEDEARLRFYEGGFHYDLHERTVMAEDGGAEAALIFFPEPGRWTPGAPWVLADWVRDWGAMTLRAAQEAMGLYGRLTPAEVAERFPAIRRRAHAWVANRARPADPEFDIDRDVMVTRHEQPYPGFYAAEEVALRHRRFDGSMGDPVQRSALMTGQAAVVLPYDPRRDAVLLIQQFRAPVYLSGDRAPWVWEPVAGLIDPGETAESTARREAEEEAGLTIERLEPAGAAYSSTGSSSEYVFFFIGLADFATREGGGGLDEEHEDIRVREVAYHDLMKGVDSGDFKDLPLLLCANWLARHHDRLRATP